MRFLRRVRATWSFILIIVLLFAFVSNLVWNAWRTAAADKPLAADENNQVILQTLPVIVPGLFGTDTPTPSVLQINPQILSQLNPPTATRTPTPINLGNFVWDDIDSDGRQDAGEPGLSGVTVQLWNSAKTQLIASGITNANGNYTVIAPLPGQYRIRVLLANAAQSFSPKDQAGGDNILDSDINPAGTNLGFTDIIDIASNVISMTSIDAGVIVPLVFQPPVLQQIPIITPTNAPFVNLAPPVSVCTGFRLTSPLDGLPNGVATFYWDPVGVQGALYQIVVMNEGRGVLAVFTAQNATSLSVDVSPGAIGGGFQVIVQINAILNGQVVCSDEHAILRAAPDISAPSIRVPQPTPTRPIRGG